MPKSAKSRERPSAKRTSAKAAANATFLHTAFDGRVRCRYLLFTIDVAALLRLVKPAYESKGAIEGQRDAIRTATAARIRRRLTEDLKEGAIIPPIVLGAVSKPSDIDQEQWDSKSVGALLKRLRPKLSIIDGMQRTTALLESSDGEGLPLVRVELWLAPSSENLIYRMLVLNTGQLPWNLRRQLEVVHRGLIDEIQEQLQGTVTIYKTDDRRRRTEAGEFQANDIIEMYLAFKLRKPHVDKESVLSDQFSKLDLTEAVSSDSGLQGFVSALRQLTRLDAAFARDADVNRSAGHKFPSGRHIFDKVSACTGFMAAYAQFVFGKIGMDRPAAQQAAQASKAEASCNAVHAKLTAATQQEVGAFLALDTLAEVSQRKGGALSIGEQERELFLAAFRLILEDGQSLPSLEPAWRSQ
jgi:hypothetical protein